MAPADALAGCAPTGARVAFLTNNPLRRGRVYAAKLTDAGHPVRRRTRSLTSLDALTGLPARRTARGPHPAGRGATRGRGAARGRASGSPQRPGRGGDGGGLVGSWLRLRTSCWPRSGRCAAAPGSWPPTPIPSAPPPTAGCPTAPRCWRRSRRARVPGLRRSWASRRVTWRAAILRQHRGARRGRADDRRPAADRRRPGPDRGHDQRPGALRARPRPPMPAAARATAGPHVRAPDRPHPCRRSAGDRDSRRPDHDRVHLHAHPSRPDRQQRDRGLPGAAIHRRACATSASRTSARPSSSCRSSRMPSTPMAAR